MLPRLDILNELLNVERLKNVALVGYVVGKTNTSGLFRDSVRVDNSSSFVDVKIFYLQDQYKKGYVVDGVISIAVGDSVEIGHTYAFKGTLSATSKDYTRDVTLLKFAKEGADWVIYPVDVYDLSTTRFIKKGALDYLDTVLKNPLTSNSVGMFDTNVPNTPMIKSYLDLVDYGSLTDVVGTVKIEGSKLTWLQRKLLSELSGQPILQIYLEESPLLTVEDLAIYLKDNLVDYICYNFVDRGVVFERILAKLESNGILGTKSNIIVFTDEESIDRNYAYVKIKKGGLLHRG